MIVYEKQFASINLLARVYGSPWPRAMVLSISSSLFAMALKGWWDREITTHSLLNPYPYSIFAALLGFIIIFRTNLSYQRYWEARTSVSHMSSRWADAAIQVISFDESAKDVPGGTQFRAEFVHSMSLMHAMAMQRLRGDRHFDNLSAGSYIDIPKPPPVDPGLVNEWMHKVGLKSYISLRVDKHHFEQYWELMSLPVIGGTHPIELQLLRNEPDPVYHIFCWIHRLLVARRSAGGINQDAPIVSRIYQMLSDGMLSFENATKLMDTPFPFPFAQCCAILLHINALCLPFVMVNYVRTFWLAGILNLLCVFAYYLVNEVAREIEEPFKFEPNELPVTHYHYRFNGRLVTAFSGSLMPEEGFFPHISDKVIKHQVSMKWTHKHKEAHSEENLDDESSVHVWKPPLASFREVGEV